MQAKEVIKVAKSDSISVSVIKRLPRYYRFLGELLKDDTVRISSQELAARMKLTASQIRQDLNCFGGFGQQGYGYNVADLHEAIGHILGVDTVTDAIMIGCGNLGRAIAAHINFTARGCRLVGIFDADPNVVGSSVSGIEVMNVAQLEDFCRTEKPLMAILCIPKAATQEIADKLVGFGIKGFWNFSHYDLSIEHENIVVENVHLGDSLMTLIYRLNDR